MVGWLIEWLNVWLIDWLIDCVKEKMVEAFIFQSPAPDFHLGKSTMIIKEKQFNGTDDEISSNSGMHNCQ